MKSDDHTDIGGDRQTFLTTHWSLIESIGTGEDSSHALIGSLLKNYWKPVYCYLRRHGYGNEEAKDLTQAFFHEIVLGNELVQQADQRKGRFRSFLLTALRRYCINVKHKENARKRVPKGKLVALDVVDPDRLVAISDDLSPDDCFNSAWVSSLLERVFEEVEASCHEDGMTVYWKVFEQRVLLPIMDESEPPSVKEICGQYGIPAVGGDAWHLGKGVLLDWSQDSKYIYYHRYQDDRFIYKKASDNPQAEPERIIYSPSYFPAISPDEEYIAYEHNRNARNNRGLEAADFSGLL